jgi:hypothetical protein
MTFVGIPGDVTSPRLGLDDRERRERPAAVLLVQARGALEETAVQVEDVSRVRLSARRAAEEK